MASNLLTSTKKRASQYTAGLAGFLGNRRSLEFHTISASGRCSVSRRLARMCSVVVLIAVGGWRILPVAAAPEGNIGKVESAAGGALLLRGDQNMAATANTVLQGNDVVHTGNSGLVRIRLTDNSSLLA